MTKVRTPRSTPAAQQLLERFAELDSAVAQSEATRSAALAATNAAYDGQQQPLLEEMAAIREALAGWWPSAELALTKGERKSIELGGCMIGTRAGRESLLIAGDEASVIEALRVLKWAKPFLREKITLDKRAVLKALPGPRGGALAELGLSRHLGRAEFFVARCDQAGTLAKGA